MVRQLSTVGGVLEFRSSAWQTLVQHRQIHPLSAEAGGLLLGRMLNATDDVVVDVATPPNANDQRSRFGFSRARATSQAIVDAAWRESGGTRVYLGEWHTHPEDDPSSSTTDEQDRRRILKNTRCESPQLYFVIVGRRAIRVWVGDRLSGTVREVGSFGEDA